VLSLFLILFCDRTSSECTQLAPCICALPDGDYYDLTGLADSVPLVDNKFNLTVHFHPCTNVKMKINGNTTCANGSEVSLCISNNNKTLSFGTLEETRMKMSSNNKFPVFEIHHNDTRSVINIVCFSERKTGFVIESAYPKENNFMLISPYGCKIEPVKGLSTGSVLVILFFTIAGVYFIGGIILLKTLRGATGWEMVPNHDFWCKLPSLVKDGVVFTFNCCRGVSYDRI